MAKLLSIADWIKGTRHEPKPDPKKEEEELPKPEPLYGPNPMAPLGGI
jgi:hypothetical protein